MQHMEPGSYLRSIGIDTTKTILDEEVLKKINMTNSAKALNSFKMKTYNHVEQPNVLDK